MCNSMETGFYMIDYVNKNIWALFIIRKREKEKMKVRERERKRDLEREIERERERVMGGGGTEKKAILCSQISVSKIFQIIRTSVGPSVHL